MTVPEHNFTGTLDEWEDRVVSNAAHFVVFRKVSRFERWRIQVGTLAEAIEAAKDDEHKLVYAVTETGRSVCVERKKWEYYLKKLEVADGQVAAPA